MRAAGLRVAIAVAVACVVTGVIQPAIASERSSQLTVHVSPTTWHLTRLTGISIQRSALYSLDSGACPSRGFCLVVGSELSGQSSIPLIEHWNGHAWSRVRLGLASDTFDAVACASTTYCMVVGANAQSRPLAEVYAAGRWTRRVVQRTNDQLTSVACPRVGTCVVVGSPFSGLSKVPLMSWQLSRGRWRWIPVVLRISALEFVRAMSCAGPTTCELVGGYSYGGPGGSGFIERFDGRLWRPDETQVADRGGFGNVSCLPTNYCVATENLPWPIAKDANGQTGFVAQAREARWITLGRGLPGPAQLIVDEAGAQCFRQGWCVVTAGSAHGMFVARVVGTHLEPLAVVRHVRLHGFYPYLSTLACADPSFCVQLSDNPGSPFVLIGSVSALRPTNLVVKIPQARPAVNTRS